MSKIQIIETISKFNPNLAKTLSNTDQYPLIIKQLQEYLGYEYHLIQEELESIEDDTNTIISNASVSSLHHLMHTYHTILKESSQNTQLDIIEAAYTVTTSEYFAELMNKFWQIYQNV